MRTQKDQTAEVAETRRGFPVCRPKCSSAYSALSAVKGSSEFPQCSSVSSVVRVLPVFPAIVAQKKAVRSGENNTMDLFQLETFLSVAQTGSFSAAAKVVHRTQPAVSQLVRRLEEEVGESLFDRSSRDGMLTDAGRVLQA